MFKLVAGNKYNGIGYDGNKPVYFNTGLVRSTSLHDTYKSNRFVVLTSCVECMTSRPHAVNGECGKRRWADLG
mgnify:CR=1 FL=1